MKRVKLLTAVLLITALTASACGGTTGTNTDTNTTQDLTTESSDTTADSSDTTSDTTDDTDAASTDVSSDASTDEQATEEVAPEEIKFGKKGEIFGLSFKVRKAKIASKFTSGMYEFSANEKGDRLLKVDLTVKNTSDEDVTMFKMVYNPNEDIVAKAIGSDGTEYDSLKMIGLSEDLHDRTLEPGKSRKGSLIFELPKDAGKKAKKFTLELSAGDEKVIFKLAK